MVQGRRVQLSESDLRRVWGDASLPTYADKARALGCCVSTFARAVKPLGLPPVSKGPAVRYDPDLLRAAWLKGVSGRGIARAFGLDQSTISNAVRVLGLEPRAAGFKARRTWEEFWAVHRAAEARAVRKAAAEADAARCAPALVVASSSRPALPAGMRGPVCHEAARRMYQAVLLEMWRTALELVRDKVGEFERAAARRWFGTADFDLVCQFAGVDPDVVLQRYRAARARMPAHGRAPDRRRTAIERIAA